MVRCFQKYPRVRVGIKPISAEHCRHVSDRPADTEPCQGPCRDARWHFGDWSQVSGEAGRVGGGGGDK